MFDAAFPMGSIATLPSDVSHDLLLAPQLAQRNPMIPSPFPGAPGKSMLKHVPNKNKYKMLHLYSPEDVLIPATSCDVWNPSTKSYLRADVVETVEYEVNEEWCPRDFRSICQENLTTNAEQVAAVVAAAGIAGSPINPIIAASMFGLRQSIGNSLFNVAWFSDPTFNTVDYPLAASLNLHASMSVAQIARLSQILNRQEGFLAMLRRLVGEGKVNYIDSNDGTYLGNATVAANVTDYLDQLIASATPELRYFDQTTGSTVKGVILAQSGITGAYAKYMRSVGGSSENWQYIVNGNPVPGMMHYMGYTILEWSAKDAMDYRLGLYDATLGFSKSQQAIFMAPEVLTLVTKVTNQSELDTVNNVIAGVEGGISFQVAPDQRAKGLTTALMYLRIGMGIAHSPLVVYSYNSSTTFDVTP